MTDVPPISYKILIDGPFSSGKTEFIKAISEIEVISTEKRLNDTVISLDFGRLTVDETFVLYIFGTPGARRLNFVGELATAGGFLGIILMVDSRRPETFREARSIAQRYAASSTRPYVFAANKQDLPDAWDVEALRIALQIPSEIPIVPCIAKDRESVKRVLLTLLDEVLKDINEEEGDDQ